MTENLRKNETKIARLVSLLKKQRTEVSSLIESQKAKKDQIENAIDRLSQQLNSLTKNLHQTEHDKTNYDKTIRKIEDKYCCLVGESGTLIRSLCIEQHHLSKKIENEIQSTRRKCKPPFPCFNHTQQERRPSPNTKIHTLSGEIKEKKAGNGSHARVHELKKTQKNKPSCTKLSSVDTHIASSFKKIGNFPLTVFTKTIKFKNHGPKNSRSRDLLSLQIKGKAAIFHTPSGNERPTKITEPTLITNRDFERFLTTPKKIDATMNQKKKEKVVEGKIRNTTAIAKKDKTRSSSRRQNSKTNTNYNKNRRSKIEEERRNAEDLSENSSRRRQNSKTNTNYNKSRRNKVEEKRRNAEDLSEKSKKTETKKEKIRSGESSEQTRSSTPRSSKTKEKKIRSSKSSVTEQPKSEKIIFRSTADVGTNTTHNSDVENNIDNFTPETKKSTPVVLKSSSSILKYFLSDENASEGGSQSHKQEEEVEETVSEESASSFSEVSEEDSASQQDNIDSKESISHCSTCSLVRQPSGTDNTPEQE